MTSPTVTEAAIATKSASDLAFAFENLTLSQKKSGTTNKSSIAGSAANIDLRDYSQTDRELLSHGHRVLINVGNVTIVDLPRALFLATSTKPELLNDGRVYLPHDTEREGVLRLITYLKDMIWWRKPNLRLMISGDVSEMLSTTAAAAALGIDKYTNHIYRKCEANLRNHLPGYKDLNALTFFANVHPRLLEITISQNLAVRIWENTLPDPATFAKYLERNTVLREKIYDRLTKHDAWLKDQAEREARHRILAARAEEKKTAALKARAEREEWEAKQAKKQKAKDAKDKTFWDQRKIEDTQDEQSIKKKLTLPIGKRKFTPRERAHWNRTRGTKLPKGC